MSTSISIASDHGGYELKSFLMNHFSSISFIDLGTSSTDSVHYPMFADALCNHILNQQSEKGILICGTGIGISMRANRYPGIRAAVVHSEFSASMAKAHNNANVLCLGERTTTTDDAIVYINAWLSTEFEGDRHQTRIDMLDAPIQR